MPLVKIVGPDEAQGDVKDVYDAVKAVAGQIPKPLQVMSATPGLLKLQKQVFDYFIGHGNLGMILNAHIRYVVARHCDYQYCIDLNANLLTMFGSLTEEDLEGVYQDPGSAKLEEKDLAMFQFVVGAVKDPGSTSRADADRLRELGWTDADIVDAMAHGAGMVSAGIIFKAMKMDED